MKGISVSSGSWGPFFIKQKVFEWKKGWGKVYITPEWKGDQNQNDCCGLIGFCFFLLQTMWMVVVYQEHFVENSKGSLNRRLFLFHKTRPKCGTHMKVWAEKGGFVNQDGKPSKWVRSIMQFSHNWWTTTNKKKKSSDHTHTLTNRACNNMVHSGAPKPTFFAYSFRNM